jgi:hypothetical protein
MIPPLSRDARQTKRPAGNGGPSGLHYGSSYGVNCAGMKLGSPVRVSITVA